MKIKETAHSLFRPRRPGLKSAAVALLLFSALLYGCGEGKKAEKAEAKTDGPVAPGRPALTFSLKTFDGAVFDLAAQKGRPVVINFWASWCGPCRYEAPEFRTAHRAYGERVEFIGVAVQDEEADSRRFLAEFDWKFKAAPDKDDSVMRAYRVFGIPMTVIVDSRGVVSYVHTGIMSGDVLRRELDRLL